MRPQLVAALIFLLYWTAIPSGVLAVEPRYPDSEGYKKCMANCKTPGTPENKAKLYLVSCDNVCVHAGEEELAEPAARRGEDLGGREGKTGCWTGC